MSPGMGTLRDAAPLLCGVVAGHGRRSGRLLVFTVGARRRGQTGCAMHGIRALSLLLGRLLMSSIFLYEGVALLRRPSVFTNYFASVHVPAPGVAIWIAIVIQLAGGLAILLGFKARWAAAVLAIFCLGTAFGVHLPAGDSADMIHFYKNLVMAGGFIYVVAYGAGRLSIDGSNG